MHEGAWLPRTQRVREVVWRLGFGVEGVRFGVCGFGVRGVGFSSFRFFEFPP